MYPKIARFYLYRYQLLPIDRHFQGDMLGAKTIEELMLMKNYIFREALKSSLAFQSSRMKTVTKLLFERDNFYLYRIAANRSLSHETIDFRTETIDNWPKILLVIWNDPDKQLIAVQHRTTAFQYPEAVVRLLFDSIESILVKRQLTGVWEPLIEKQVFWDLVDKNIGSIQEVAFEIITPNMANISGALSDDLKNFARETNSVRNKISISSDPKSSLNIQKENKTIDGLVDYSSQGGGDISLKISGLKKRIHTSKTVKEVEVDELRLQGEPDSIAGILKEILS